jgi:Ni,Fe-hydrogenase maturation factor
MRRKIMNATTILLLSALVTIIALITLITIDALRAARREIAALYGEIRVMREENRLERCAAQHHREHSIELLRQLKSFAIEASLNRGEPLVAPRTEAQRSASAEVTNPVELDIEPIEPSELTALSNLLD